MNVKKTKGVENHQQTLAIQPGSLITRDNKIYGLGTDNQMYRWDTHVVEWKLYKFEEQTPKKDNGQQPAA